MESNVREVKLKRSDSFGYGFSICGGENCGFPPVIYEILRNSPADSCGLLEPGDVIVEVNNKNVTSMTTKEVLKCLRLSNNAVTLKVKKDETVKQQLTEHMTHSNEFKTHVENDIPDNESGKRPHQKCLQSERQEPAKAHKSNSTDYNSTYPEPQLHDQNKAKQCQPKFETFMMTGDLIINLNSKSTASALNLPIKNAGFHEMVPPPPSLYESNYELKYTGGSSKAKSSVHSTVTEKNYVSANVRTSQSDNCLKKVVVSSVNIPCDGNNVSPVDGCFDSSHNSPSNERIVWTYNAPVSSSEAKSSPSPVTLNSGSNSSAASSKSSPIKSSCSMPENILMPADPDESSFSSSFHPVDKNAGGLKSRELPPNDGAKNLENGYPHWTEQSVAVTDDSTNSQKQPGVTNILVDENKVYVQVLPNRNIISPDLQEKDNSESSSSLLENSSAKPQSVSSGDSVMNEHKIMFGDPHLDDECQCLCSGEEDSDVESICSFHYSPKAIDVPSALRLAKRLYNLEGFKKSDVAKHLCKNNDFSRVVAEEYLKFFDFKGDTLDGALRKFLKQFCLIGETQERERVLIHFSKRYLDCNAGSFKSQDAVHTLTCALLLLNTDLHGENVGRRMTCSDFIENLAELNDGENFPKDILKSLYHSIKSAPLEWAADDKNVDCSVAGEEPSASQDEKQSIIGHNPFLEIPNPEHAMEYKKGYIMRKCCIDPHGKKTPMGKRSWKMFYATLRDLVLYLHKDENGFRKNQLYDSLHNSIRIHHALATKASDYTKKRNVFRLQTADEAEYLFQTSDHKELQSWIDTINYVAASLSAPPLASGIGSSHAKFQKPLLPSSHSRLNAREQLVEIETNIARLEKELEDHLSFPPGTSRRSRSMREFIEKESYLQFELKRYRTYAFLLHSKIAQFPEIETPLLQTSIGEVDETCEKSSVQNAMSCSASEVLNSGSVKRSLSDRYSYRAAIYRSGSSKDGV